MNIGVLGAGQLGRMLALAGLPLGHRFAALTAEGDSPMRDVATVTVAGWEDAASIAALARSCDVLTYEFENVPLAAAAAAAAVAPLRPGIEALRVTQDRWEEKKFLQRLGIPIAPVVAIDDVASLSSRLPPFGLPAVLKTRRLGYDGKGQVLVRSPADLPEAAVALQGASLVAERLLEFRRELSIIAVRSLRGEEAFYPLVENRHRDGILRLSVAPAAVEVGLQRIAEDYARRIMRALDYVGTLTVELFDTDDGLLVNEIAPRVHNSGHWSIEASVTSQFENHVRAITGAPLGSTAMRGSTNAPLHAAMHNLIGVLPDLAQVLALPGVHPHLYGKSPRLGRKLGHITVEASGRQELTARLEALHAVIGAP